MQAWIVVQVIEKDGMFVKRVARLLELAIKRHQREPRIETSCLPAG
jgi:hypothetical protein